MNGTKNRKEILDEALSKTRKRYRHILKSLKEKDVTVYGGLETSDMKEAAREYIQEKDDFSDRNMLLDKIIMKLMWSKGLIAPDLNP